MLIWVPSSVISSLDIPKRLRLRGSKKLDEGGVKTKRTIDPGKKLPLKRVALLAGIKPCKKEERQEDAGNSATGEVPIMMFIGNTAESGYNVPKSLRLKKGRMKGLPKKGESAACS